MMSILHLEKLDEASEAAPAITRQTLPRNIPVEKMSGTSYSFSEGRLWNLLLLVLPAWHTYLPPPKSKTQTQESGHTAAPAT